MAELKTNGKSAEAFLKAISDKNRRKDAIAICKMMAQITRQKPKMWGSAIVGFGSKKLVYKSGRELDWMLIGFSPRKSGLVFYLVREFPEEEKLLAQLGKHKNTKGCLYIKRLTDVDLGVLKNLIKQSVLCARKT
jgi:hypothetical protein